MFCSKINAHIRQLLRQFDNLLESNIDTALQITTQLKALLSSSVADLLTELIPGNIDDIIRKQLIYALDRSIEALAIANTCKDFKNINDKLKCFAMQLSAKEPHMQDAILQKLASLLAGELDGKRLKQNIYDLYTQAKYTTAKN